MISLSVTEAARHFVDLIHRVCHRGESAELTEGGKAVVRVMPARALATGADLAGLWRDCPHLDGDEADRFEQDVAAARGLLANAASKSD
jgi:antitoxin (DNA-binding transcriptional repressor) of toxin-antitoxin stability system